MNHIVPNQANPPAQPTHRDLTAPTHGSLIAGARVSGTPVYDLEENKIGSIEDVMIDKLQGSVSYAVLSFGSFMGFGGKHYPLPWSMLRYNTVLEGYQVKLNKAALENAPTVEESTGWTDDYDRRVRGHYDEALYWPVL